MEHVAERKRRGRLSRRGGGLPSCARLCEASPPRGRLITRALSVPLVPLARRAAWRSVVCTRVNFCPRTPWGLRIIGRGLKESGDSKILFIPSASIFFLSGTPLPSSLFFPSRPSLSLSLSRSRLVPVSRAVLPTVRRGFAVSSVASVGSNPEILRVCAHGAHCESV